ncbi:hypothetical protein ACJX0J_029098, partial [Zea mays]
MNYMLLGENKYDMKHTIHVAVLYVWRFFVAASCYDLYCTEFRMSAIELCAWLDPKKFGVSSPYLNFVLKEGQQE